MNDTPAQVTPLWSDERIGELTKSMLTQEPNHTPKGLVRRVTYAMREEYEANRQHLIAELAESQAYILVLERTLQSRTWEPVGVRSFLTDNATLVIADEQMSIITDTDTADCYETVHWTFPDYVRLCERRTSSSPTAGESITDAAPVPSAEVRKTVEGLLTSAIAGTESTIRTRDYHGLRKFATTEEEWIERYKAALAWLNRISAAEADQLRYALDFAVEQNEEMAAEIDNIRQENSTLFDRAALRLAELKATQAELAESQRRVAELERALGEAKVIPILPISYIIDTMVWDYNSPLGEAALAVRSWLLKQTGRTSSSPTAQELDETTP